MCELCFAADVVELKREGGLERGSAQLEFITFVSMPFSFRTIQVRQQFVLSSDPQRVLLVWEATSSLLHCFSRISKLCAFADGVLIGVVIWMRMSTYCFCAQLIRYFFAFRHVSLTFFIVDLNATPPSLLVGDVPQRLQQHFHRWQVIRSNQIIHAISASLRSGCECIVFYFLITAYMCHHI